MTPFHRVLVYGNIDDEGIMMGFPVYRAVVEGFFNTCKTPRSSGVEIQECVFVVVVIALQWLLLQHVQPMSKS